MEAENSLTNLPEQICEELARDLLNRVLNVNLEPNFDSGVGFDLWYKNEKDEIQILVQVDTSHTITSKSIENIVRNIEHDFESYKTIKYVLIIFSEPDIEIYQEFVFPLMERRADNFYFYDIEWIKDQLSKHPDIIRKYNINIRKDDEFQIDNKVIERLNKLALNRSFFNVKHLWGGNNKRDQLDRFIKEGIWESELIEKDIELLNGVKGDDFLFARSFFQGSMRIRAYGIVTQNPQDGHKLYVNWQAIDQIDLPDAVNAKGVISRVEKGDEIKVLKEIFKRQPNLFKIINNIGRDVDKSIASIKEADNNSTQFWWINASDEYWKIDDFKVGDFQTYSTHNRKGTKRQVFQHFFNVRIGDLCIGYQSGKNGKTKAIFEITKEAKNEKGDGISFKLIRKLKDNEQYSFSDLKQQDYFKRSEVVQKNNQGSIFKLTKAEYYEIYSLLQIEILEDEKKSSVIKTGLDNDGAYTTEDLLEIENDVRSFALILAAKDIKPPIAVALFGKWGSGKSFFMEHLSKRVNELSINQGFVEEIGTSTKQDEEKKEESFCKGIAQIKFNAWSYLDANLWAGLVSSIFEKLDEYISNRSKGDIAKLELRKQLSDKLEILATEKKEVKSELGSLENEKLGLQGKLETLKTDKDELIRNIAEKKLSEIIDEVRSKSKIEDTVKAELKKYGITEARIKELSPSELYSEVNSWVTFFKNLFKFSIGYIVVFILASLALLFVWIDPSNIATNFFNQIGREITAVISILGPLFAKGYNTFTKYRKFAQPITDYKNKFNKELEEAKFEYEQEKSLLEIKIKSKQTEIEQAEVKITEIDNQIEELKDTLNNFVAKRAFNNFIKRKVSDKRYEEHLGLISIIRKDFETLSELFQETQVDEKAPEEIQRKQREKLNEHKKIVELFEDEKVLNRIILYIDDLDRCSDEKVLEVIQAVHLLMAFPLFNVVVGVDKRCVHNALIYKNLLQYSQFTTFENIEKIGIHVITPGEYLEKIFQIPFQLDCKSSAKSELIVF